MMTVCVIEAILATNVKAGLPMIGIEGHDRRLQDRYRYISWESTKAEEKRQEHKLNSDLEVKNMIRLLKIQRQDHPSSGT
jgi:hypothetical protein